MSLETDTPDFFDLFETFPNDEAATKLLWLALRNVLAKSVRAAFDWKSAMNQFAMLFGDRFTQARG
ncbi:hypothetical protein Busp01_41560 [Trinickia caryophylli]|uniref:Transposase, Mutator family n=1 Tax=Trinickia caryophylli TaxID=28094 RepID=A0A1X7F9N0_TRICW|nr:hypothetical protein Busp01_41560 [Trinickia caryophylli]SMF48315.1 hypothetical protein SAMN06295900_10847 [Trinickia caryophylli]